MIRALLVYLHIICMGLTGLSQPGSADEKKLTMLFMGDIMGHDSQIWSAEDIKTGTYDYNDVFMYVKPLISRADIAIANFEVTLAGPPYKGYPRFSSPAALAEACRNAGIRYVVTANNHAADRGEEGIRGTINRLDSLGIAHTGTFLTSRARDSLNPLIINKSGFKVALLNYTYGTNGLSVPDPLKVNLLEKYIIAGDIERAVKYNPDLIVLFLHWGNEYDTIPTKAQTELADYFFERGADMIIGSHPHVLQKMVWLKDGKSTVNDRIVVYSLGNFISNQRKPKTDGGSMVRIDLVKSGNSVSVTSAGYYLTWVYTPIINYDTKFYILPCSEFENKPDFFNNRTDYLQMTQFIKNSRSFLYKQNINFPEFILKEGKWLLNK